MGIRRTIITIATALALVAGGTAALASQGAPAAGPPAPIRVNLAQAFKRAFPHVKQGRKAGIIYSLRHHRVTARTAAGCTEPNCDLVYHSGAVQHSPHVYILLWGPNWTNSDPQYGVEWYMFHGLGITAHDTWSTITSQYGDGSGNPAFGSMVFVNAYQDTTTPPNPVTPNDLAAEAHAVVSAAGITDLTDAQIVISAQSGTCYSDGYAGDCGVPQSASTDYCAWHDYEIPDNVPFTNLPYQTDAGAGCGENFVNPGSGGTYDGVSLAGGHEYAETITDPFPATGWIDTADTASGGEIGDKCAFSSASRNVVLSTGSFAMQPLWSNATGGCVISTDHVSVTSPGNQSSMIGAAVSLQVNATSAAGLTLSYKVTGLPAGLSINSSTGLISGTPTTAGTSTVTVTATDTAGAHGSASFTWTITANTVTVTSPGNQAGILGTPVSLQIHAGDSASGQTLTYKATALPSGLSISSAGLITGKPSVTAATYAVKVTATDTTGAHGSVSFTWAIKSGTGAVKGYLSKCADDYRGLTANGNKIDISTCTGRNPQKLTFLANGELTVEGKCIRDSAGRVILYTCNGAITEQWTRHSNGEYVIRYNGQCLTAPSAINGTQLTVAQCTGSTHQVWSLP